MAHARIVGHSCERAPNGSCGLLTREFAKGLLTWWRLDSGNSCSRAHYSQEQRREYELSDPDALKKYVLRAAEIRARAMFR